MLSSADDRTLRDVLALSQDLYTSEYQYPMRGRYFCGNDEPKLQDPEHHPVGTGQYELQRLGDSSAVPMLRLFSVI